MRGEICLLTTCGNGGGIRSTHRMGMRKRSSADNARMGGEFTLRFAGIRSTLRSAGIRSTLRIPGIRSTLRIPGIPPTLRIRGIEFLPRCAFAEFVSRCAFPNNFCRNTHGVPSNGRGRVFGGPCRVQMPMHECGVAGTTW